MFKASRLPSRSTQGSSASGERLNSFITDTVCDCFVELCASFGVAAEASSCVTSKPSITSVLGFTGSRLYGSLAISTTHEFLARTRPVPPRNELEVRDWGAELVNRLVGRFRNKLEPYGIDLRMATPVTIEGPQLDVAFDDPRSLREALWFASPPGHVAVLVDAVIEDGVEFSPRPNAMRPVAEGDFLEL